jgi:hypothetical protein
MQLRTVSTGRKFERRSDGRTAECETLSLLLQPLCTARETGERLGSHFRSKEVMKRKIPKASACNQI